VIVLAGCASGDFGRVRPTFVTDDMHAWVGTEAARLGGAPISSYPLTDDERLLRDLAYPLIEPPYDRNKWFAVLAEYGAARLFFDDPWVFDRSAYSVRLMSDYYRSASARYALLVEDIRNDSVRIAPFFALARRVLDMDQKREKSLAFVSGLTEAERRNALARVAENRCAIAWVHRSLTERAASYRFALERLVIAEPSPVAADAERILIELQMRIAENRILPPLRIDAASARAAGYRPRPDLIVK
jgi:hypothetical protein